MVFSVRTNFDEKLKVWSGGVGVYPMNCRFGFGQLMLSELDKAPADYVIQINHNTGRKVTCSEMRLKAIKFAETLTNNMGIHCEDNITIISAHHDDLVSVVIGASATGAIINPLDPSFSTNEIVHFMKMTLPKLVICDQSSVVKVQQSIQMIGSESKVLIFGEWNDLESIDSLLIGFESTTFVPDDVADLNQTALVMCSSGTTGTPKGVLLSHSMATNGLRMWWSVKSDEIYFSTSNLYWLTSFGLICHSIMHRCPRIIVESNAPVTASVVLDVLIRHKVNVTFVSPAIAIEISALLRESKETIHLESIRVLACGGSFVSHQLVQSMSPFIPNGQLFSCYGMTELSGLVSSCEACYKKDTVGQLEPEVEISIVDDEGRRLLPEQSGEICVRHKLYEIKGYLNNESENQNAFDADKWFRTGDIGFFDSEGFLHLVDRKKEMLKYCNYQISPTELEMCIQKHFAVDRVCVIGIDDEKCGQLPAAVIVPKKSGKSLTEDAVTELIADYFSDSKRLRGGVFFVNSLPMTSSGKVQRKLVKQMISIGSKN